MAVDWCEAWSLGGLVLGMVDGWGSCDCRRFVSSWNKLLVRYWRYMYVFFTHVTGLFRDFRGRYLVRSFEIGGCSV